MIARCITALLALATAAAQIDPIPVEENSETCSSWTTVKDHNAYSGRMQPACDPKLIGNRPPCPSCWDDTAHTPGNPAQKCNEYDEIWYLGVTASMEECQKLAKAFGDLKNMKRSGKVAICDGLAWVGESVSGWAGKCSCGTTRASFNGAVKPLPDCCQQKQVVSAYCRRYYSRSGWGVAFSIALAAFAVMYVGIGYAFGSVRAGAGMDISREHHPHWVTWVSLGGLVLDGVAFVRGGGKRGAYAPLANVEETPKSPSKRDKEAPRKDGKREKRKGEKKDKHGKRDDKDKDKDKAKDKGSRKSKKDKGSKAKPSPAEQAPQPPPEPSPISAKPPVVRKPVAYRGDEWTVKPQSMLSAGARETGVKVNF